MQELLRTDKVMKQINGFSNGSASRTAQLMYATTGAALLLICFLHMLDTVLGWCATLILQVVFLLTSVFGLVVLMEYQERQGYEPGDVERVMNPLWFCETIFRVAQLLQFIWMGSYWLFLIASPVVVYTLFFRKVKRADTTRLWKDINDLLFEAKGKLAFNTIFFFVVMFGMITSFIGSLF